MSVSKKKPSLTDIYTAPVGGYYTITGSTVSWGDLAGGINTITRGEYVDPRTHWTEEQWLDSFKQLEQFPEALKAMDTIRSKLYKALK